MRAVEVLLRVMSPPDPDGVWAGDANSNFLPKQLEDLNSFNFNGMSKRFEKRGVGSVMFIDVDDFDLQNLSFIAQPK